MSNQENELKQQIEKLSSDLQSQQTVLKNVISILMSLHNVVNEGFKEVNGRLATLEGKHGMEGVNNQLAEIKTELMKIQHVHGYQELYDNQQFTQGQA